MLETALKDVTASRHCSSNRAILPDFGVNVKPSLAAYQTQFDQNCFVHADFI